MNMTKYSNNVINDVDVSIIVPVYNSEKTIKECFNSLEKQTLKNIEIIYIDDGSTDNSYYLLKQLCIKSSKSVVYHKNNGGPSSARNFGINNANGKLIMFCDSDDVVEETWCQELYMAYIEKNYLPVCHMRRENKDGHIRWSSHDYIFFDCDEKIKIINLEEIDCLYKAQLLNSPCNKLYSKEIIDTYEIFFSETMDLGEDLLFNINYISHLKNAKICLVNKVLYRYIDNNNQSLTMKYNPDYFNIQHEIFEKLIEFFYKCNIVDKEYFKELYYDYFFLIYNYFDIYMKSNNDLFIKKAHYLNKILKKDSLLDLCFKFCDFKEDSIIATFIFKRKNYYLIWLFQLFGRGIKCLKRK